MGEQAAGDKIERILGKLLEYGLCIRDGVRV